MLTFLRELLYCSNTKTRRLLFGFTLLLIVNFLWVGSSEISRVFYITYLHMYIPTHFTLYICCSGFSMIKIFPTPISQPMSRRVFSHSTYLALFFMLPGEISVWNDRRFVPHIQVNGPWRLWWDYLAILSRDETGTRIRIRIRKIRMFSGSGTGSV